MCIRDSWNSDVYEYDRTRYDYNWATPFFGISYNRFNGASLTLSSGFTRQKYGKEEYSSRHSIRGSVSTQRNTSLNYTARFHQVLKKWDIPFEVDFASPEFRNNFYGVGNNTILDDDLEQDDFYRFERNSFSVQTGIGKEFWKNSSLDFLVGYARSSFDVPENTILEGDTTLFGANTTLGEIPFNAKAIIDFRDQAGLPYNGIMWTLDYQLGAIIEGTPETSTYGVAQSAIEYFISTQKKNPLTLGLRFGGAVTHGDVPFYHLPNIGQRTGLRGFFGERFTGNSSMYFNSEIRWQLLQKTTSVVPIKFGLKVFYDTGRVDLGADDVDGTNWHAGYGFGVFLVPLTEAINISFSVAFSEEESFFPVLTFGRAL